MVFQRMKEVGLCPWLRHNRRDSEKIAGAHAGFGDQLKVEPVAEIWSKRTGNYQEHISMTFRNPQESWGEEWTIQVTWMRALQSFTVNF